MKVGLAIATLVCSASLRAQTNPSDTSRSPALDTVVVTAERTPTTLGTSIASVTRLAAAELAEMPHATLADVLRRAPGFTVIDADGLGFDPRLMVRGFYGGGEAEYVVVLIDGRPVNQLQSGLVAWDVLPPLASIEAVEIVRGSASPLYGDAAIGGVINVITRKGDAGQPVRWDARGGTFGTWRADVALRGPIGITTLSDRYAESHFSLGGGIDRTRGFRDHSSRTAGRAHAGLTFGDGPEARLALTARSHWREFEEPGPLLESLMAEDRASSDALFRFDRTEDRSHAVMLDGRRRLGGRTRLSGGLGGEIRNTNAVRTLALAAGFGDTKLRELASFHAAGNLQLEVADSPLPGTDWIVVGIELSHGALDSKYFPVAGGTREDYAVATGEPGEMDAHGDSRRLMSALHAQYTVQPSEAFRFAIGARFDALRDAFRPDLPADVDDENTTHSAFSPRVGVNVRYLDRSRSSGNLYATVSRSFKAPTLDQLHDLRSIPVPFPPFAIRTANPDLAPQRGTSVEAGIYQSAELSALLRGTLTVSAYHMDMKDELDFSVETFRYVNIGRSRHRGVEAGATFGMETASLFTSYSLQSVTSRSGETIGKRLKAIPQHTLSGGVTVRPTRRLETSLLVSDVRDVYLDDANTVELSGFTRVDARAAVGVRGVTVFIDARNLLDRRYSTTGFLDPGGSGETYFQPAAGRSLGIGVRGGW